MCMVYVFFNGCVYSAVNKFSSAQRLTILDEIVITFLAESFDSPIKTEGIANVTPIGSAAPTTQTHFAVR